MHSRVTLLERGFSIFTARWQADGSISVRLMDVSWRNQRSSHDVSHATNAGLRNIGETRIRLETDMWHRWSMRVMHAKQHIKRQLRMRESTRFPSTHFSNRLYITWMCAAPYWVYKSFLRTLRVKQHDRIARKKKHHYDDAHVTHPLMYGCHFARNDFHLAVNRRKFSDFAPTGFEMLLWNSRV